MTLYDYLEEFSSDTEKITSILIQLDSALKYLHGRNLYIYDFNPKKIIIENGRLTFNSFRDVLGILNQNKEIENQNDNIIKINIFQENKIGLMAYNNMPVDGNINQKYFEFLQENLNQLNKNGRIPEDIYEYYGEVFNRLNVIYMNDYLLKKQQETVGIQNTNVRRKNLATKIGMAFAQDDAAYVNILLIPSIITFVFLLILFTYTIIVK